MTEWWSGWLWGFGTAWLCIVLLVIWLIAGDRGEVEKLRREADDHLEIDA